MFFSLCSRVHKTWGIRVALVGWALSLVVLVQRDERLLDPEMGEEPACVAGILARDEIRLLESSAAARGQIVRVADRRRHHQELTGHAVSQVMRAVPLL